MICIRNSNRLELDNFYNEATRLYMTHKFDWEVGEFWLNFLLWLQNEKKIDGFLPEETEMVTYLKEYYSNFYD